MPHAHHGHRHARQLDDAWNDLVEGVESVAKELNPFKPTAVLEPKSPNTIFKTVYKTMEPTFEGPIGGYSTMDGSEGNSPNTAPTNNDGLDATTSKTDLVAAAATGNTDVAAKATALESLPSSINPTASVDLDGHSSLAIATDEPTLSDATGGLLLPTSTPGAAASSASASASATSAPETTGPTPATQAGIAFGVLGGVLTIALIIFFVFNKRKRQMASRQAAMDDEKINGSFGGAAVAAAARPASLLSTKTTATAPQVSLRPITQFNPTFGERRSSKGAALALSAAAPVGTPNSMWERPSTRDGHNPENPFGNNAARAYTADDNESVISANPFNSPEDTVGMAQTTNSPPRSSPISTAAAGGAAAVGVAAVGSAMGRKASTRKNGPAPLDLTMPEPPPSPAGTEYSMHSISPGQSPVPSKGAAAIADAGGPATSAVHRVQLDFQPTLEDELDLRAGQLVRLLREYDDGWALCIRLDRSKQGVAPRTCLSTRPVKPRPAGGPGTRNGPPVNPSGRGPRAPGPHQGQRPMTPQGGPPYPRPESPMRAMTPTGRPQSPMGQNGGRPASPAGGRPMSPSGMAPRGGPAGPSPMNPNGGSGSPPQQHRNPQGPVGRKPVPGQAY